MNATYPTLTVAIDQRLAGYRRAGIARYALELGSALSRLPDVEVIPLRHARDREAPGDALRLRTPSHHRFEEWLLAVELPLRRIRADVYHATDFIAPRLRGTPVVATAHDLAFLRWPEQLSRDALAYYSRVLKRPDAPARWIVPSEWTKADLCERLGVNPERVAVVPHGVSSFIGNDLPAPRDLRHPIILAVGTIEPRKRYDLLLDAFEHADLPCSLRIVGEAGWNTEALQRRLAISPKALWLAGASDDDVRFLLREATALVIPSLAEGFGLTALEAMACGTPVISSGLGALPEVTGDCALQPDADDAASWAAAIRRIVDDSELWEALSVGGLRRSKEFSWESSAQQTLDVYRQATT